ncbi:MAG: tetratricopeptide repeat protein [Polyangiaceae bacterium]
MRRRRRRLLVVAVCFSLVASACAWDPSHPFDHDVGAVNQAISALDAGDATIAAKTLEDYLSTGQCDNGSIGTPDFVKRRPDGTFDLGLSLFKIGESYGNRFGDEEEADSGSPEQKQLRQASVNCALHVAEAVASGVAPSSANPREIATIPLRARAHFLEGNLHFLLGEYEEAVKAYDAALTLAPGEEDAGDPVGRDAAWNRAIALQRIEDKKKDSGAPDSGNPDGGGDGGGDGGADGGGDSGGGDSGSNNDKDHNDAGKDGGGSPDAGPPPPPQNEPDAGAPPPPPQSASADDRILDQLERAPTVQQEAARKAAAQNHSRGMVDK